jgi:hypothetical protein
LQLWTLCVRTKRGLVDTGRAGGYCKDQVSFAGLMQLLQNRERVSFELLHSCKLPWQCVASNPNLQKAREFGHPMLVPAFIMEGEAAYRRRLDDLVQVPSAAAVQQAPRPITRCSGQRSRPLPRLAHLIGARVPFAVQAAAGSAPHNTLKLLQIAFCLRSNCQSASENL